MYLSSLSVSSNPRFTFALRSMSIKKALIRVHKDCSAKVAGPRSDRSAIYSSVAVRMDMFSFSAIRLMACLIDGAALLYTLSRKVSKSFPNSSRNPLCATTSWNIVACASSTDVVFGIYRYTLFSFGEYHPLILAPDSIRLRASPCGSWSSEVIFSIGV